MRKKYNKKEYSNDLLTFFEYESNDKALQYFFIIKRNRKKLIDMHRVNMNI